MRHPRSRCTFETMAHRKKQVWQPGGGPSGATCCGALLIILSAFLSFSFRSRSSSVSLRSCSLLPLFAPLPSFSSSSRLLSSPARRPFPGTGPCAGRPLLRHRRSACRPSFWREFFIVARRCLLSVWEHATFHHYHLRRQVWLHEINGNIQKM